jgi:hypothetical protein
MTTLLTPTPAQAEWIAHQDARLRIERVLDGVRRDGEWPLPVADQIIRPEAAYLTVASLDDLGPWVAAFPAAPVVVSASSTGFEVWTLLADADDWRGGAPVAIRVAATVVAGETDLGSFLKLVRS